jgi:transcriptional regulator with XRE-family HTH domain
MVDTIAEKAPMTIADRIKQLRKEHGLTQEDLAAKAGLGVATIQRVERGERPSAATIASIASSFGLSAIALTNASRPASIEPSEGSYLPLAEITSGKRLIDLAAMASSIDFDYMEIQDESTADLLGQLYELCRPRQDQQVPSKPSDRIRLDIEAGKLLTDLKAKGVTISSETYVRTGHEIDDDCGTSSLAILIGKWDETCLVLRVGTQGVIVDRADVEARLPQWYNTSDPRIVRPTVAPEPDGEECPF